MLKKEELVNVRMTDDCVLKSRSFLNRLRSQGVEEYTSDNLFKALAEEEKVNLLWILVYIIMEAVMMLLGLLSLQMLIQEVSLQGLPTP